MSPRITAFESSELHDYVTDTIAPHPVQEIPSNRKGYRSFMQGGKLILPEVMANVAIFRLTYMESIRRRRSRLSRMFVLPPSTFESFMVIDLQEPSNSIDIHMYPEDAQNGIQVVAGDFTERKDSYVVRDPSEDDLARVNQIIEAIDARAEW